MSDAFSSRSDHVIKSNGVDGAHSLALTRAHKVAFGNKLICGAEEKLVMHNFHSTECFFNLHLLSSGGPIG